MELPTKRILRLAHTLQCLKPSQLVFYVLRRGLPVRTVKPTTSAIIREGQYLDPLLPITTFENSENSFTCLNQTVEFNDSFISWNPPNKSRLWCYHLHYFDQLRDINRSKENKQFLVDDWIKGNPQGSQLAWEPYTVSLRIVNWVAFMLGSEVPRRLPIHWLDSLYEQTLWLERNDERHILANHYFENIKAWLFAGVFFQGSDAERWLKQGKRLLLEQLSEQFLADGGHYERSPHYHALMLENLLDLLNLSKSNSGILGTEVETALEEAATKGLAFLHRITYPNGSTPLFNDSVNGSAPSIGELYAYASKFFDIQMPNYSDDVVLIDEPDSGLYGYRQGTDMLLVDCGDIGPDYQPGHTHCDFLSFELMLDGKPLIVNSGVYEYQGGEMRDYVRSSAAHNTLSIDGLEQSEIWGEFRVARRAIKLRAKIRHTEKGGIEFRGGYSGFPQIAGGITHKRRIRRDVRSDRDMFVIQDKVQGEGVHRVDSYLHFHPDIAIKEKSEGLWHLASGQSSIAYITVKGITDESVTVRIEPGWYCPEFGIKQRNQVLVISTKTVLTANLSYRIERTA